VGKAPFGINPYAMILGEPMGSVKIISGKYGKILGVHIIGPGAVDLIGQAALAIQVEATVEDLGWAVPMHPSSGEAQVDAAQDVEGMALHLPKW
jgi:dihydrolipoamide dehydrogenase